MKADRNEGNTSLSGLESKIQPKLSKFPLQCMYTIRGIRRGSKQLQDDNTEGTQKNARDRGAPKILSSLLLFKHLMDITVGNCLYLHRQYGLIPPMDHIVHTQSMRLPQVKKILLAILLGKKI